MFISANVYGWDWLTRPVTAIILVITLYGLLRPLIKYYFSKNRQEQTRVPLTMRFNSRNLNSDFLLACASLGVFVAILFATGDFDEMRSSIMPQSISTAGIVFAAMLIVTHLFIPSDYIAAVKGRSTRDKVQADMAGGEAEPEPEAEKDEGQHLDLTTDFGDLSRSQIRWRAFGYFAWCIGFFAGAQIIGLLPATIIFMVSYIRFHGRESWAMALSVSVPIWIGVYVLFHQVLHVPWPQSVIGDLWPVLRTMPSINFF